jgi:hypothetical protein
MRQEYLQTSIPVRLEASKATRTKLQTIQRLYFPSFSVSSIVKILFGVYANKHKLVVKQKDKEHPSLPVPSPKKDPIEILDCHDDDVRIMALVMDYIKTTQKRVTAANILTKVVSDF